MKKLAIALMLGAAAVTASAQVNYTVQTACHPLDVKHYDTQRLRSSFNGSGRNQCYLHPP